MSTYEVHTRQDRDAIRRSRRQQRFGRRRTALLLWIGAWSLIFLILFVNA